MIRILALSEAKWDVVSEQLQSNIGANWTFLMDVGSAGLSAAGALCAYPGLNVAWPIGVVLGVGSVGLTVAAMIIERWDAKTTYKEQQAGLLVLSANYVFPWKMEDACKPIVVTTGSNLPYNEYGCWASYYIHGLPVPVGVHVRTQFSLALSAQNRSYAYDETRVRVSAGLKRSVEDVDFLRYTWLPQEP